MKRSKRKCSKQNLRKAYQHRLEALWKLYAFARDGKECQVEKYYPKIHINHSDVFQVDHCFSRSIKELFCDVANSTVICSVCNQAKGSGKINASKRDAVTVAVHEIVKTREGVDVYNRLLEVAGKKCAFLDWKDLFWLETQCKILEELLDSLRAAR